MLRKRDSYHMVADDDPNFARFWNAYPKRVSKKDARRAWAQLNPDDATVDKMLTALSWQVLQPAWLKDGGQFIPYPASWLRSERWDDEPFTPVAEPPVMRQGRMNPVDAWLARKRAEGAR